MKKLTLIFVTLALSVGQTIAQDYKTIAIGCYKNTVGILQKTMVISEEGSINLTKDDITFTALGNSEIHKVKSVNKIGYKTRIFTEEGHRVTISLSEKTITIDKTKTNDGLYYYTYIYHID